MNNSNLISMPDKIRKAVKEGEEALDEEILDLAGQSLNDRIRFLKRNKNSLNEAEIERVLSIGRSREKKRLRRTFFFSLIFGLALGGGSMYAVNSYHVVSEWTSIKEENFYQQLASKNGGLDLEKHCQGSGRVEVDFDGKKRQACLVWPPTMLSGE